MKLQKEKAAEGEKLLTLKWKLRRFYRAQT